MKNKKGFTFVEAIVVAAIISIIALVGIPVYNGYITSTQLDCARSNLELIGAAIIQTHNRGSDIPQNSWATIGISDPSDDKWAYTFNALTAAANTNTISITATGAWGKCKDKSGAYSPTQPANSRFTSIFTIFNSQ